MRLKPGAWKEAVAAIGRPLRGVFWTAALGLLAAVLIVQAVRAHDEVRGLDRRRDGLEREVERLRQENRSLQDELHALETDPLYVESVLRDRKMVGPGERPVK